MNNENEKVEELNDTELMRLIYEEVKRTNYVIDQNNKIISKLEEHDKKFDIIDKKLLEHDDKFIMLEQKVKCVDEKIDNTKNELVTEIAEEFNNFSIVATKLINNLENKLDNEINDRKTEISKVKDFNKIILNDFGSRISILEEESENYNLN